MKKPKLTFLSKEETNIKKKNMVEISNSISFSFIHSWAKQSNKIHFHYGDYGHYGDYALWFAVGQN